MVVAIDQFNYVPEATQSYLTKPEVDLLDLIEVIQDRESALHSVYCCMLFGAISHLLCHSVDESNSLIKEH